MEKTKILFLAANASSRNRLSLEKEAREIENAIRASDYRDFLEFIPKSAVRASDLLPYFDDNQPDVVHLSGHGTNGEEIVLLDDRDQPVAVTKSALENLFKVTRGKTRLVVLNACYSLPQAHAVVNYVDAAIGMNGQIEDSAAILFAAAFYRALGGKSIKDAFDRAKAALLLNNIPGSTIPELVPRPGTDQEKIVLVDVPRRLTQKEPDVSTSRLPSTGEILCGREQELELLTSAWQDATSHIIALVAFGGVGKSTLVNHWLAQMALKGYGGAERVFGWSFYRQGTTNIASSADDFIEAALTFFTDPKPEAGSNLQKAQRLARLIQASRTILLLDGLEPLQYPPGPEGGRIKDPALALLVRELASANNGLCIVTTRYMVADLRNWVGKTVARLDLELLSKHAGAALLLQLGASGSQNELEEASNEFGGHALALTLLGTYLRNRWGGSIARRNDVALMDDLIDEDIETGGHAKRIMLSYAKWFGESSPETALLRMIGLFDRPVALTWINSLRANPVIPGLTETISTLADTEYTHVQRRLREARLLIVEESGDGVLFDAHPLIREYFGNALQESSNRAWRSAHSRLYEYFRDTNLGDGPFNLREMEPLFQAVSHGCKAGRHGDALREVYLKQIMRGNEYYAAHKLQAFGRLLATLASFFEQNRWDRPAIADPPDIQGLSKREQILVLTQAAVFLINIKGYGTPEVAQAYARTLELCERSGESAKTEAFQAQRGMVLYYIARAEYKNALNVANELVKLANVNPSDSRLLLEAHFAKGIPLLYLGQVGQSLQEMLKGVALYDPAIHHKNAFLFGHDPGIACRCFAGWAFALIGCPDQAAQQVSSALELAEKLSDPFGSVFALYCSVIVYRLRGDIGMAAPFAERLVIQASKGSYAYWLAGATIYHGWILAERGNVAEGIARIKDGLKAWRSTGAEMALSYWNIMLAEVYAKAGRTVEAMETLQRAEDAVEAKSEHYYEPEIYRMRGELLIDTGSRSDEGEQLLKKAVAIARSYDLRWFEIRAYNSLYQLLQSCGRQDEIKPAFLELYQWFREGFQTPELKLAKQLLLAET